MEFLSNLWLPILASAAAVWIVSAIIWMALPHHRKDWIPLPDEDAMTPNFKGLPPGNYSFPYAADNKTCMSPEFKKKWEEGPAGMLNIYPKMSMPRNMVLTFLVYLVVSLLIAYVASVALLPGADKVKVFQLLGTVGVLAYSFAFIPNNIWFNAAPRAIVMNVIDGIVYGLVTGGIFALLWPAAQGLTLPLAQ